MERNTQNASDQVDENQETLLQTKDIKENGRQKLQVSSEYKMCSSIFEPPPPTAQTEHARDLKFCMVGP